MIYIDVTDLALHAARNVNVTGIQRVSLSVLGALLDHPQRDFLKLIFVRPGTQDWYEADYSAVFRPGEVMSLALLATRLGLSRKSVWLPRVQAVRSALRHLEHRKLKRSLVKVAIYAAYVLGVPLARKRFGHDLGMEGGVPLRRLSSLPSGAALLSLGAPWAVSASVALAKAHAARGGRVVQVMHDLIPHVAPQYCRDATRASFANWLTSALDYVSEFVCVSNNTCKDLNAYAYLTRPGLIVQSSVVPLAHEFEGHARVTGDRGTNLHQQLPVGLLPGSYLLCVGTIEARKNPLGLLEAWHRIGGPVGNVCTLVFAGRPGWLVDDFFRLLESNAYLRQSVKILPDVTDSEMAALYGHCAATIYPSHYEGWGLPVGESAWFGKLCLTSQVSSLPEVLGALAVYFDQCDTDDMARNIRTWLSDAQALEDKEKAIKSAPLRTWKMVAEGVLAVCEIDQDQAALTLQRC